MLVAPLVTMAAEPVKLSIPAEPGKLACRSIPEVAGACEGVTSAINTEAFLKRWPSDVGIRVSVQEISPRFARHPLQVIAGQLEVYRVVSDGKRSGMRPIYVFTMSSDTDNLSEKASPHVAGKFMGSMLARHLNKLMESGAVDK